MIEKFSEEELKQIKKELGISEKNNKENIFYKETKELRELWREKPYYSEHNRLIYRIIDITLCNFRKGVRYKHKSNEQHEYLTARKTIKLEDEDEYRQMFQEILEIIKKHNRKWGGEERSSE